MSDVLTLSAEARDRAGKGASRALRREGRVPAVIYGNNEEPTLVHVEEKLLNKLLGTGHFFNSVVMVEVGGKTVRTLPKDVEFHPVTDRPLHADFLRIGEHSEVHVEVPVKFTDEALSPGMKRGAVLVDISIDQGGCFETSHATTHAEPTFIKHDVVHYCVANMPGAVARTSTFALNNATLAHGLALADKGWKQALTQDPHLREGLNVCEGKVTCEPVAQAHGLPYVSAESVLGL